MVLLFNVSIVYETDDGLAKNKDKITTTHTQKPKEHLALFIYFSNVKKRLSLFVFKVCKRARVNRSMCVSFCSSRFCLVFCIRCVGYVLGGYMMDIVYIFYNMFYFW